LFVKFHFVVNMNCKFKGLEALQKENVQRIQIW
jgi:hypothetical protein